MNLINKTLQSHVVKRSIATKRLTDWL